MLPLSAPSQPAPAPQFLPMQRLIWPALVVILVLLAGYALVRNVQKVYESRGAIDFHPYWYYGHFVREGINPYSAFAAQAPLPDAVAYIDGSVVAPDAVRQPRLAQIPANTAPLQFFFTPFAYLPWMLAKSIWLAITVVLVLATPWLAMRLLPSSLQLSWGVQWVVALSYYAMKGPRVAIANGQPSIIVFFLMIVTLLLRQRHWLWAGIALGVALSKYSIALPVAIFLLFEKRWRLLVVAFLVQLIALVAVSMLEGGGIVETVRVNLSMLSLYSSVVQSVHLGALLHGQPLLAQILIAVGTIVTLGAMVVSWRRGWIASDVVTVNSLLLVWILLSTYHRDYDLMLLLFFWILCLSAVTKWQLPRAQTQLLGIVWLISVAVMCMPGESVPSFLSEEQGDLVLTIIRTSVTGTMVVMWIANLWLLRERGVGEKSAAS